MSTDLQDPPAAPPPPDPPGGDDLPRPPRTVSRRLAGFLHRHRTVLLLALLALPLLWLVLAYIGSLGSLLLRSVYQRDDLSGELIKQPTTDNLRTILTGEVYRSAAVRTVGIAAAVTVIDLLIALPIAVFIAKVARPRWRRILVAAVVTPLWASYVVKAYAWRALLDPAGGVLQNGLGVSPGFGIAGTVLTLAYLWLPYMVLPIYAGLDRLPDSLLEASSDLGAKAWTTFRSVIVPLIIPAILAGSIFTFSLTLGDYIAVQFVGGTSQTMGLIIYKFFIGSNDLLAAAYALVPIGIMVIYLLAVRKSGALENL
jgi:ABC-type spermidine/putrescine transport system permease subunit I